MEVTVIHDTAVAACEGGCALEWITAEFQQMAAQQLAARFGESVAFNYVDLAHPGALNGLKIGDGLPEGGDEMWPILLIDGRRKISGPFDIRMMLDAVEAEMEMSV